MDIDTHYKLRITTAEEAFEPEKERKHHSLRKMMWDFLKENQYIYGRATAGTEIKGKGGSFVRQHFHIHFASRKKHDCVKKAIKRFWDKELQINLSGNEVWSCQIEPYIDVKKFWHYPLKQQTDIKEVNYSGFKEDEIKIMIAEANAVCRVAQQVHNAKKQKKEESDTLYDRLERYLDKISAPDLGDIIEFYMKENRPINDTTVVGYYRLYQLKKGRMSPQEYAAILKSKYL